MKPLKNGPEICHSNYVSMFTEIGITCNRLISILGNYDPQYIPFYFYYPMMSKANSSHKILQEPQDNHYSCGTLLDEIVSAHTTL